MRQAAFVRNVMLGRQGVTGEALLAACLEAGATDPRSYLATGNLTFTSRAGARVAAAVSAAVHAATGRHELVAVRSISYLRGLGEPFGDATGAERCVTFLPPGCRGEDLEPMVSARGDMEILRGQGSEVWSVTHLVDGRPGPVNRTVERLLRVSATSRSWTTVERILRDPGP